MRDTFIARLTELARNNPRIMLITGDLGFGVLVKFWEELPAQFLNAGVAEQNMTGMAAGLALDGRVVFTYSIANFPILRCLEQIRNDAAYHDANVKVVSIGGGFSYGALGMSHHATEDLSIMRALPGITVVAPGDLWETAEATSALVETSGTCYLRLDKGTAPPSNQPGEVFELGKARVLRDGHDLTLVACGGILACALEAADKLAEQGLRCRVISSHTLRPFDSETVFKAARETGGIMTIEEHVVEGGLGGLVAETCLEGGCIPANFYRIGLRNGFSSIVGSQDYLRERYGMGTDAIMARARKMVVGGTQSLSPLELAASP